MLRGSIILRIGLAVVFIYFALRQIQNPTAFLEFAPSFITENTINLIYFNAIVNGVIGLCLLFSLLPRIMPLVAAAYLLLIIATTGFSETTVRDFGLAMGALSLVFIHEEHMPGYAKRIMSRFFTRH